MTVVINGTTGVSGVAGSASTPALIGSDADSGYYINSANEPNASVNGTAVWNAASTFGFKNRIINGAMVIDQRNAGAAVTLTNQGYGLDRWTTWFSQASKYTVQQNQGSVTPPAGFAYYQGVTSSSAYSVVSSDYFGIGQKIEGYNISDLAWGTANAKSITISFWVRSSLTGNFGVVLRNNDGSYYYATLYAVNSANTWEQKSIVIPGPTVGTWNSSTSTGIFLFFGLGAGSSQTASSNNTWVNGGVLGASGATSFVGTNGATWYITGVQLEVGSTATSFDFRDYGRELALCQRYYFAYAVPATCPQGFGDMQSTTAARIIFPNPVPMRTTPTFTSLGSLGIASGGTSFIASASSVLGISSAGVQMEFTVSGATTHQTCVYRDSGGVTFSAEL